MRLSVRKLSPAGGTVWSRVPDATGKSLRISSVEGATYSNGRTMNLPWQTRCGAFWLQHGFLLTRSGFKKLTRDKFE